MICLSTCALDFIKEADTSKNMFGSDFEGSHFVTSLTQTSLCLKYAVHQGSNEYKKKSKIDGWLDLWRCAGLRLDDFSRDKTILDWFQG